MMKKQTKIFFSVIIMIIIVITFVFINIHNGKKLKKAEIVKNDNLQKVKNVSNIAKYALLNNSLQHTTKIANRNIKGNQEKCIVVEIENFEAWNKIRDDKQVEIIKGLINTSRLQINKTFGCVVIENQNKRLLEGFWQDTKGYVIIKKTK